MSQSLAFLLIGLATLVGFYDLLAFVSVFRSDRSVNSKALWSLLIAVLPVLGVLIWASPARVRRPPVLATELGGGTRAQPERVPEHSDNKPMRSDHERHRIAGP